MRNRIANYKIEQYYLESIVLYRWTSATGYLE